MVKIMIIKLIFFMDPHARLTRKKVFFEHVYVRRGTEEKNTNFTILQRQDEKYLLKFHTGANSIVPGGTRDEVSRVYVLVRKLYKA